LNHIKKSNNMIVNRTILKAALEIVKPALANKEMIAQSSSFVFLDDKIITYNDEISISYPFPNLEIKGAVKAEEFYELVSKISKEEFEIVIENNELRITAGRIKAGLVLQKEVQLPLEELGILEHWKTLPEQFIEGLKFVLPSCSTDMSLSILICVHVDGSIIEATDNHRLAHFVLSEKVPGKSFLIPSSAVKELIKMNPLYITDTPGWIHFKTEENTIISCRTFQDKFPNTSDVLHHDGVRLIFPKTLNESLDKALVFAKKTQVMDEFVIITIENNRIQIKSESEVGWYKEEANIKYSEKPIQFTVTPLLLKDILSKSTICIISNSCVTFEGPNWVYVAMLRINKE